MFTFKLIICFFQNWIKKSQACPETDLPIVKMDQKHSIVWDFIFEKSSTLCMGQSKVVDFCFMNALMYASLHLNCRNRIDIGISILKLKTYHNLRYSKLFVLYVKSLNIFISFNLQDKRFAAHDNIDNRRLLWHGTNVAVVAAILKSGLRIMPHSGGRVGRGIYFASEHSKSAGYGKNYCHVMLRGYCTPHQKLTCFVL